MGVDGIGSGGRPVPGSAGVEGASRSLETEAAEGSEGARGSERSTGSALLDQLQRGEIDVEHYLDTQVSAAMSHLEGALPAAQLDFIRETLREQIASDPVLAELARRATGSAPPTRPG